MTTPPAQAAGDDAVVPVMVVMDTSGSMNESAGDGDTTKIEDARRAVIDLVDVIAPDQRLGLISYPGESPFDRQGCQIGETQVPLERPDGVSTALKVRGLEAGGDTPTSPALLNAARILKATASARAVIVLVSDGEANCGAPVCETAKQLRASGIELTINTVGFDTTTDSDLSATLQCVAKTTGGRYANARNSAELRLALRELAGSNIEISAPVPETIPVAVGRTAGSGTHVSVEIANTGSTEAADVRVSLDFTDSDGRGGALLVTKPIRFVGNLPPRSSRILDFEIRPDDDRVDESFTWYATVTTVEGGGDLETGTSRTVSQADFPLGSILQVDGPVAVLGDSYSSGEGAGSYLPNTAKEDSTGRCTTATIPVIDLKSPNASATPTPHTVPCKISTGNACHRSQLTYGGVLFGDRARVLACSGAMTSDFYDSQMSGGQEVKPQLQELRAMATSKDSPGAVMLTIGGNDAGFGDLITACAASTLCWTGPGAVGTGYAVLLLLSEPDGLKYLKRIGSIANDLLDVYRDTSAALNDTEARKARGGKIAPIVVLPYVRIVPEAGAGPDGCFTGISREEIDFLNSFIDQLNSTISSAVLAAQRDGLPIYFAADVEDAMQPDHTICDGGNSYAQTQRFDYGVGVLKGVTARDQQWLHPNAKGYRAIAGAVAGWSRSPLPTVRARSNEWGASSRSKAVDKRWPSVSPPLAVAGVHSSGSSVSVSADGYAPGSQVVVYSRSTPHALGSARSDSNGAFSLSVQLPDNIPTGRHSITASGLDADGQLHDVSRDFTVLPRHSVLALLALLVAVILSTQLLSVQVRQASRQRPTDPTDT